MNLAVLPNDLRPALSLAYHKTLAVLFHAGHILFLIHIVCNPRPWCDKHSATSLIMSTSRSNRSTYSFLCFGTSYNYDKATALEGLSNFLLSTKAHIFRVIDPNFSNLCNTFAIRPAYG